MNAHPHVVPKPVLPTDMTCANAGYFLGMQAASDPNRTFEWVAPKMVMFTGGTRATYEPKMNSSVVRFVAAKKIAIAAKGCFKLH